MAIKLDKTNLVRTLAVKNKLVPHLERVIGEGDFEWEYIYKPKEGDDAWHPSGHCTPTLNELYWIAKDPQKEKFGPGLYKTFQVGHFWHQWLQYIVEKKLEFAGPDDIERRGLKGWGAMGTKQAEVRYFDHFEDPVLWRPFHWVTGSGDIAPCDIPGYGEFVVDFKTMGSHDYKKPHLPDWCAAKYECQINVYMDFFNLDKGLIVAILKDSPHEMKEFTFERNQPLIDALYQKWELVSHCLDEGIEPPVDEEIALPLRGVA